MKKSDQNKPYMVIVSFNKKADYKFKEEIKHKKPIVQYFKTLEGAFAVYMEFKTIIEQQKRNKKFCAVYKKVELEMKPIKVISLPPTRMVENVPTEYNVIPVNGGRFLILDGVECGFHILKEEIIIEFKSVA